MDVPCSAACLAVDATPNIRVVWDLVVAPVCEVYRLACIVICPDSILVESVGKPVENTPARAGMCRPCFLSNVIDLQLHGGILVVEEQLIQCGLVGIGGDLASVHPFAEALMVVVMPSLGVDEPEDFSLAGAHLIQGDIDPANDVALHVPMHILPGQVVSFPSTVLTCRNGNHLFAGEFSTKHLHVAHYVIGNGEMGTVLCQPTVETRRGTFAHPLNFEVVQQVAVDHKRENFFVKVDCKADMLPSVEAQRPHCLRIEPSSIHNDSEPQFDVLRCRVFERCPAVEKDPGAIHVLSRDAEPPHLGVATLGDQAAEKSGVANGELTGKWRPVGVLGKGDSVGSGDYGEFNDSGEFGDSKNLVVLVSVVMPLNLIILLNLVLLINLMNMVIMVSLALLILSLLINLVILVSIEIFVTLAIFRNLVILLFLVIFI